MNPTHGLNFDFVRPRAKRISLTALIDVVFILLMFFMLTSSFTHWRVVDFHSPTAAPTAKATKPQILIVSENNSLRLQDSHFSVTHFRDLQAQHLTEFNIDAPVVLLTETEVNVQTIVSIIEKLKEIGLDKVTFGHSITSSEQ